MEKKLILLLSLQELITNYDFFNGKNMLIVSF